MRLYINTNEVPALTQALTDAIKTTDSPIVYDRLSDLLERVTLCKELQGNNKRSAKGSTVAEYTEVDFE